jgi:hypothetical protein
MESPNIKFCTIRKSPDDNLGYEEQSDSRCPWQFFLPHMSSTVQLFLDAGGQVLPHILHLTRGRRTGGRVRGLRYVSPTISPRRIVEGRGMVCVTCPILGVP